MPLAAVRVNGKKEKRKREAAQLAPQRLVSSSSPVGRCSASYRRWHALDGLARGRPQVWCGAWSTTCCIGGSSPVVCDQLASA